MARAKIIYGIHAVLAAIEHQPENILTLYCQEKREDERFKTIFVKAQDLDLVPQTISRAKLDKLTQSEHHQGIAANIRPKPQLDTKDILEWLKTNPKPALLLILEGIQDPHNLGACLRSAQAFGVDWVIIPKSGAVALNPTVSKVACGAAEILQVVTVSNIARFIEQIQQLGVWVIGTASQGAQLLSQVDLTRSVALVMGTEGDGLKRLTLESCDSVAKIPLKGSISSLNVSVATGICLYECQRQRL